MVQYLLAIAIAAFSIVSVIMGGPTPESLLLLAFTGIGVIALFPGVVRQHRVMLIGVFQALSTGLIIFGWLMVLDAGGETMTAADLGPAVTFVTVGAFGLLTISIPASMIQQGPMMTQEQPAPQNEGSLFAPQGQDEQVNPHLLFSQIDSVLRQADATGLNLSKPTTAAGDDDPTTHFSQDELQQIRSYAGKVSTAQDEDPTALFSKNEIDEIRQYADRLYGDSARKE